MNRTAAVKGGGKQDGRRAQERWQWAGSCQVTRAIRFISVLETHRARWLLDEGFQILGS